MKVGLTNHVPTYGNSLSLTNKAPVKELTQQ